MKTLKNALLTLLITLLFVTSPSVTPVYANCHALCGMGPAGFTMCTAPNCDTCNPCAGGPIDNSWSKKVHNMLLPTSLSQLKGVAFTSRLLNLGISIGFVVGSVLFLFLLITGAISWLTAGGDKTRNEQARKRLTNGAIGLFILFSIFAIINLVKLLFDVDLLNLNVPTI